jgi:hypothetical protein
MRALLVIIVALCATDISMAVSVDPNAPNGIAAQEFSVGAISVNRLVLCTDGTVHEVSVYFTDSSSSWVAKAAIPVAIAQVQDWSRNAIVTHDGRVFLWFPRVDGEYEWTEWDADSRFPAAPCGAPVGSNGSTMGSLKSLFR